MDSARLVQRHLYWVMRETSPAGLQLLARLNGPPNPEPNAPAFNSAPDQPLRILFSLAEPLPEGPTAYTYLVEGPAPAIDAIVRLIGDCEIEPLRFTLQNVRAGQLQGLCEILKILLLREYGLRAEHVEVVRSGAVRGPTLDDDVIQLVELTPTTGPRLDVVNPYGTDEWPFDNAPAERALLAKGQPASRPFYLQADPSVVELDSYVGLAPLISGEPAIAADPLVWLALTQASAGPGPEGWRPEFARYRDVISSVVGESGRLPTLRLADTTLSPNDRRELQTVVADTVVALRRAGVAAYPLAASEDGARWAEIKRLRALFGPFRIRELAFAPDMSYLYVQAADPGAFGQPLTEWLRDSLEAPAARINGDWAQAPARAVDVARLQFAAERAAMVLAREGGEAPARVGARNEFIASLPSITAFADWSVLAPVFELDDIAKLRAEIGFGLQLPEIRVNPLLADTLRASADTLISGVSPGQRVVAVGGLRYLVSGVDRADQPADIPVDIGDATPWEYYLERKRRERAVILAAPRPDEDPTRASASAHRAQVVSEATARKTAAMRSAARLRATRRSLAAKAAAVKTVRSEMEQGATYVEEPESPLVATGEDELAGDARVERERELELETEEEQEQQEAGEETATEELEPELEEDDLLPGSQGLATRGARSTGAADNALRRTRGGV